MKKLILTLFLITLSFTSFSGVRVTETKDKTVKKEYKTYKDTTVVLKEEIYINFPALPYKVEGEEFKVKKDPNGNYYFKSMTSILKIPKKAIE